MTKKEFLQSLTKHKWVVDKDGQIRNTTNQSCPIVTIANETSEFKYKNFMPASAGRYLGLPDYFCSLIVMASDLETALTKKEKSLRLYLFKLLNIKRR
jgi:hypothetical protein